ncbi:MAG TPA: multicopper oxidase domain-containing protein [Vicinamibacterales bacterium]|nr:multicopper oxidase domain-containing protein [Vicinamibacterales bacterium]
MRSLFLPSNASKARLRDAEHARRNRAEIIRELSWGRLSRRELVRMGLFTAAGVLAPIRGLNPGVAFARTAPVGPTGAPPSPLFGAPAFSSAMPRFDVLPRRPVSYLDPVPTAMAYADPADATTQQAVDALLGGGMGPKEGRPPGPVWAHQKFYEYPPAIAIDVTTSGVGPNRSYSPKVPNAMNSGIDKTVNVAPRFHPLMPVQAKNSVWTFDGSLPPKLIQARYGEPLLFRNHNGLPADVTKNRGFGRHTLSTHEHNGHHGAENDGFTGAFFFPNQYYDYHWPLVLAGCTSMNLECSDPRASRPDDNGGLTKLPGDWHETMSTHWFHDHMFSFTAQNVYKGIAGMMNIYSGLDRGNEEVNDGVNLRLPSGNANAWGNLHYDVNLMLCDKAFDQDGQQYFDIFEFDGFLGDVMTVNLAYKPYFEVERRKYRFRILNGSVSRFFKLALSNASGVAQPIIQIGNDGNLLPNPVTQTQLDHMGIAERFDVVIDFSRFQIGEKVHLVNLAEHYDPENGELNGKKVVRNVSLAAALSGTSLDPCVGRFLEFRVVRDPKVADVSQVPATMIPNPDMTGIPVTRERTFVFGRDASNSSGDPMTSFGGPWGIRTDGGLMLDADYGRISAAPRFGSREIWHLVNDGGGWDHPIHIHFEEGQILERDGSAANVPAWERGRKDVYRLRPGGTVTISMQFRDWGGMFMEHCHNTMHEDNAMLLRWEINTDNEPYLSPLPTPLPTPQGVSFQTPTVE